EVEGQPVTPAAQVDPGNSFRLLQPVVEGAAVQAEPLGARLRITGQVEVGLQGRDDRAVGLVEQGGEARVEAGRCLGAGRQLGQGAVYAEILPACDGAGPPDRRGDPRGPPPLAVGAAGIGGGGPGAGTRPPPPPASPPPPAP